MALRGMLSNLADVSACTKVVPAFSLIARRPSVPSDPIPESTTPSCAPAGPRRANGRRSRSAGSARGAEGQVQDPAKDRHVLVWWDHVHVVRLDLR